MTGALILALVIVVVLPVTFLLIGSLLTAVMSWFLDRASAGETPVEG